MKKGRPRHIVLCINDGTIHVGVSETANYYKLSHTTVSRQIHGQRKTAKGYYFIEVDSDNLTKDEIEKIRTKYINKMVVRKNVKK